MTEEEVTAFGVRARRVRSDRETLVVEVRGDLDILAATRLSPQLEHFAQEPYPCLVLDLRPVSFMDCSGLSLLVRVRRHVVARDGELTLVIDRPFFRRVLRLAGLSGVFVIRDSVGDALGRRGRADSGAGAAGDAGTACEASSA
ncbi:STAS domain-containing protein [Streptomyces sp. NPDC059009]|uniref:STAS domain-containing protein n=1 Tax=Streptomyces sp. NPDC059009 TaxID=3346694 RepID=UPI00369F7EEA